MGYEIPRKVQILGQDIQQDQLKYHHKTVLVSKEFTFDSAHHLHCYEANARTSTATLISCRCSWQAKWMREGLRSILRISKGLSKKRVLDRLDHKYLNETLPPMNTTAENMVVWMYEQIDGALKDEGLYPDIKLEEMRLWETPTSYAAVTRAWMEEE